MSKLQTLCEIEGYDDPIAMCDDFFDQGSCPAICMNDGCDYSENFEHDADNYTCPECKTKTMKSAMILLGVI